MKAHLGSMWGTVSCWGGLVVGEWLLWGRVLSLLVAKCPGLDLAASVLGRGGSPGRGAGL